MFAVTGRGLHMAICGNPEAGMSWCQDIKPTSSVDSGSGVRRFCAPSPELEGRKEVGAMNIGNQTLVILIDNTLHVFSFYPEDIPKMSCEIMNDKCPFEIQCLFSTADNDTRPFALYFINSSHGSQEQVVSCAYNERYKCLFENGFNSTHEAYNNLTITVPDTFATRAGVFRCQKGDIPIVKNCPYPPPEICNISSTNSGTTTQDDNTSIFVGVAIGVVISLLLVLGIVLLMRYRANKGLMNFKKSKLSTDGSPVGDREDGSTAKRYNEGSSASDGGECSEPCLETENTGTQDDQMQIDPESATFGRVDIRTDNPTYRFQQESTLDENKTTVDQEHTYTVMTNGVYTGLPISQL